MSCMLFEHESDISLWQDIKKVNPPIGFDILVYNARTGNMYIATKYEKCWNMANGCKISPPERVINITHWRLLPSPPMSEKLLSDINNLFAYPTGEENASSVD